MGFPTSQLELKEASWMRGLNIFMISKQVQLPLPFWITMTRMTKNPNRHILSQNDAEKLVHSVVSSRLDYRNSLLSSCPNKSFNNLQLTRNAMVQVLTGTNKRDHIFIRCLHLLPIKSRLELCSLKTSF